jgi:diguanylate cyclase (GGDEF)-like protein
VNADDEVMGARRPLPSLSAFAPPLTITGPRQVWVLSAILAAAAATLYWFGIRFLPALPAPIALDWWIVAAGFAIVEVLVVHLKFRRDTHSFSLSEIPLIVGLYFIRPDLLLLALLLGSGAALALHRRQPAVKLVFNLANLAFTTAFAALLFRVVVQTSDPIGPVGWGATILAAISADVVGLVMISGAIALATGTRPDVTKLVGSGSVASFFNTCLGLVTVTVLWIRPDAIWLPLVLSGLMVGAYRIYGSVRQKHESLETLYSSTRLLQQTLDVGAAQETLLAQAVEMFRAERAELLIFPAGGDPGIEATLTHGSAVGSRVVETIDPREGVWARVASEARGVCLPRPIASERLRAYFNQRGIRDTMVAPLFRKDAIFGTMLVANRVGDVGTFGADDLQLFETFANHASAAIENARLIDRLRRHADENQHQALHDSLTSLPNRTFFRQEVEAAITARRGSAARVAVLLMDLDRFKEVNDTLGHHNGDLLLQAVAGRLQSTLRPGDVVARLGGDEFGILLADTGDRDAIDPLAERMNQALATPFLVQEMTLEVGASIGIAMYPNDGDDVDTLIQRADVAMYVAKSTFRGHEFYSHDQDTYSPTKLALLGELRSAIDNGQLAVFYQPKIDVATGAIVGAEALVRWNHPRRGFVPPDEFVSVAEHTGLLRPLTLFVLEQALGQCARWRAAGFDLDVAVNLSVRNLLDVEMPNDVARLLAAHALPPSALELEITESALLADPIRTNGVLQELHGIGVGISIDDFGTGYSSLSYLRRMPVDELKIDRSFVTDMALDENAALIVRSTIDLGRNLGLRVVAEGVETQEVWEQLAGLGCHVAQGFFFGRPLASEPFLQQLATRGSFMGPSALKQFPTVRARRSEVA